MGRRKKVVTPTVKRTEFTAVSLQNMLWDTMTQVKNEKVTPQVANAISASAREITSIARIQMQYARVTGNLPTTSPILTDGRV